MSDIFSGIGQVASAAMQASAMKEATQMQVDALNRQRQFVYANLDPSVISPQVTQTDIQRAYNQLALQGQIDPALLNQRYAAEAAVGAQLGELGQGSEASRVGSQAASEAISQAPGMAEAKQKLIDQAIQELDAGATLPPDVQAELVKAGLEKSGMVTGSASPKGVGGQVLRQILGTAGVQLKAQRQKQAADLLSSAQNLETSRQNILQNLFPRLSDTQMNSLKGVQSVLQQSNAMVPQVGPSGSDIANIWLARVGATNQLAQSAAQIGAQGAMGQANAWGNAVGAGAGALGGMMPSWQQTKGWLGNMFGSSPSSGTQFSGDNSDLYSGF